MGRKKAAAPQPDVGNDIGLASLDAQDSAPAESSRQIAVVTADGRVISMPEDDAAVAVGGGTGASEESLESGVDRDAQLTREARYSSPRDKLDSALLGVGNDITLGGLGYALRSIDPDMVESAQANPGWNKFGAAAGFLIPGMGEAAGAGVLEKAGEVGGRLGSIGEQAAKGAVLGGGAYLAESGVSGDPLTIEGAVRSIGLGAAISAAADIGGSAFVGAARKLGYAKRLARVEDLLDEPPDSYKALTTEVNSGADTLRAGNKALLKQTADYDDFLFGGSGATDRGFNRAISSTVKATDATYNDLLDFARPQTALSRAREALGDDADTADLFKYVKDANDTRDTVRAMQQRLRTIPPTRSGVGTGLPGPVPAAEDLRAVQDQLIAMPQASKFIGAIERVPVAPSSELAPVFAGKMPTSLRDYLALPADKVTQIANTIKALGEGSTAHQALDKFLGDVGIDGIAAHGGDAAVATTGAHRTLNDQLDALQKALTRLKTLPSKGIEKGVKAAARDKSDGTPVLRRAMSDGAASALGKAIGHTIGGGALGGALIAAKHSLLGSLKDLVEHYGEPVGKALKALGPVTAWLANSFPHGTKDPEKDIRKLALNRARELSYAAAVAPDAVYSNLSAFHGQPNNIPLKLHQQIVGAIQHLAATAPKDPGLQPRGTGSAWLPNTNEAIALAHRLEAAHAPQAAIARLLSGQVHPAAVDTLQRTAPATMQYIAQELASTPMDGVTHDRARGLSAVIGTPMTGMQIPAIGSTLQAVYARAAQAMQPQPEAPSRAPGRPPSVGPNPLAGSNPAGLIH